MLLDDGDSCNCQAKHFLFNVQRSNFVFRQVELIITVHEGSRKVPYERGFMSAGTFFWPCQLCDRSRYIIINLKVVNISSPVEDVRRF